MYVGWNTSKNILWEQAALFVLLLLLWRGRIQRRLCSQGTKNIGAAYLFIVCLPMWCLFVEMVLVNFSHHKMILHCGYDLSHCSLSKVFTRACTIHTFPIDSTHGNIIESNSKRFPKRNFDLFASCNLKFKLILFHGWFNFVCYIFVSLSNATSEYTIITIQ
jgi:hypothetical protein